MYAVVVSGGKQHKASVGDVLVVEKIEKNIGEKIELDVLFTSNGETIVAGDKTNVIKAQAEIVAHGKDKKIVVFKYKPKKNERKRQGHRQPFTRIKIVNIG